MFVCVCLYIMFSVLLPLVCVYYMWLCPTCVVFHVYWCVFVFSVFLMLFLSVRFGMTF